MRKMILALLALAALSVSAKADWLELTPHAGYASVNMAALNRANSILWSGVGFGSVTDINSAMVLGLDATTPKLTKFNWLNLGLRGEYLKTNQAIVDDPAYIYTAATYSTDEGSLSSLLAGATVTAPEVSGLSLGLGAWLGYGYATLYQNVTVDQRIAFSKGLFSGSGLVGQLEGNVSYQLGSHLKLSFIGGWRWADFASLSDGKGEPLYDNGQLAVFEKKKTIDVDYSGVTAQGALSFLF